MGKIFDTLRSLKLAVSPRTYSTIANWPTYFADRLSLIRSEYTVILTNGLKITLVGNTETRWPLEEIILRDDYEIKGLQPEPPRTILDLGAQIGIFSLYAKILFPQVKVYAYEPYPRYVRLLKKNIVRNHFQDSIFPFPLACYSEDVVRRKKQGKPLTGEKAPEWFYPFNAAVSFAEILAANRLRAVDLVKMDVEGAEYDILYSLKINDLERIHRLCLEYHDIDTTNDLNGASLQWFLEKNRFTVKCKKSRLSHIGILIATNRR